MNTLAFLQRLSSKRRVHAALLAGLGLFGTAILVLLGIALWDVLRPLPSAPRFILRIMVSAILVTAWLIIAIRFRSAFTTADSAAALEKLHPDLGQQIRTALEIKSTGISANASREYQILATSVIHSSDRVLETIDISPLIPAHHTRLAAALAALLLMATLFLASRQDDYALAIKRIAGISNQTYTTLEWRDFPAFHDDRHPARIALQTGGRKATPVLEVRTENSAWIQVPLTPLADRGRFDVILTDRTGNLSVRATAGDATLTPRGIPWLVVPRLIASGNTIHYPAYTSLEPTTSQGGDVRSLEGADVEWTFTFSAPPARTEWLIEGEPPLELATDGSSTVRPIWTSVPGKKQAILTIHDAAGTLVDSWRYQIEGYSDSLPVVELLDPAKDIEATPVTEFPVRIRAKDDFGLAEVGLILDSAGNREWVLEQTVPVRNQRDINQVVAAMLEKVPLNIRDNVRLHAYALDHKPRGGPRAVSPLRSVDIRDFKKRSRFLGQAPAGTPQNSNSEANKQKAKEINELITKLDEIVKQQRVYTSDVFAFEQAAAVPPQAKLDELNKNEDTLHRSAVAMESQWKNNPVVTADDIALLSAAGDQLRDSSRAIMVPDLDRAFFEGDAALATLLQLRKNLIQGLMKANGDGGDKPEDPPKDIKELAREARRLAKEERDVRSQLAPPAPEKLPATRRQQEVAVYDGGELFAAIVTHCERSDGALELMSDAEKLMKSSDGAINTTDHAAAIPALTKAEQALLDLADFLDSLDSNQLSKSMEKMAEKAKQDQKNAEDAGQEEKPGQADKTQQAERNTGLSDKILKQLLEDLEKRGEADAETTRRLHELRDRNDLKKLAEELEKLGALQRAPDPEKNGQKDAARNAAKQLEKLARDLHDEAQRLQATRLRKLTEAKEHAAELKKQLGEQDKPGDKPGEKPGEGAGKSADADNEPHTDPAERRRGSGARFAGELRDLKDDELNTIAGELHGGTFDRNSLPLIERAGQRIDQLLAEFPKSGNDATLRNRIPEATRREIEDYYRDLSNDMQD